MMGTGEASGDKRAVHAAEAAIANPLLDEVSMKGAKGLLISITGGADMTLYEVDEAASRIRQEVDEDANIILGATFDESLEGVIRVSVVATGIDKPALGAQAQDYEAAEARIAEAAQRLRAQAAMQRAAEPLAPAAPVVQTAAQPAPAPVAEPAPQPVYEAPVQREAPQAVESAAPVYAQAPAYTPAPQAHQPAPQAAEAHYPSAPEQAPAGYYETPVEAQYETPVYEPQSYEPRYEQPRAAQPGHYAPRQPVYAPAAEQPIRPRPMPTISDLPRPVQEQIQQRVQAEPHVGEQRRRTLFERLAAIAGKGDEQRPAPEAYRAPPAPMPQQRPAAPSPAHAEYAKRPQAPAARPAAPQARPAAPRSAEDELEIPAFLRRQSNLG
jgi:cell division protein FtsZ